jgi:hypothetical protein
MVTEAYASGGQIAMLIGGYGLVVDIARGKRTMGNRRKPFNSSLRLLAKYLAVLICLLLALWFYLARQIGPNYTCREIEPSIIPARHYLLPWCTWQPPEK